MIFTLISFIFFLSNKDMNALLLGIGLDIMNIIIVYLTMMVYTVIKKGSE